MGCRQARFEESTIEDFEVRKALKGNCWFPNVLHLWHCTGSNAFQQNRNLPVSGLSRCIIRVSTLAAISCSAFDRFLELYQQYRLMPPTSNPDDSYHHTPGPTDYLDVNGFINPDFSLPAEFVITHMPELKVGENEVNRHCLTTAPCTYCGTHTCI